MGGWRRVLPIAFVLATACSGSSEGTSAPGEDSATTADEGIDTRVDPTDSGTDSTAIDTSADSTAIDTSVDSTAIDTSVDSTTIETGADSTVDSSPLDTFVEAASDTASVDTMVVDTAVDASSGCGSTLAIDTSANSWSTTASYASATPRITTTCGSTDARDVVYELTLTEKKHVKLSATPSPPGFGTYASLARRASCVGADLDCSSGIGAQLEDDLPAGKHYFVYDFGSTSVDATIHFEQSPPSDVTCAGATPLTLTAGSVKVTGSTTGKTDKADASCASAWPSGDDVYVLDLTAPKKVTFTLTATSSTHRPTLHVRRDCAVEASTIENGCNSAASVGGIATVVRTLPAGKYYVFADGYGTAGGYELDVKTETPKAGEACATAIPLTFSGGSASITSATTADALPDHGGCWGGDLDEVWSFDLTAKSRVTLAFNATSLPNPRITVRPSCETVLPEAPLYCSIPGSSPVVLGAAPPGRYYVVASSSAPVLSGYWNALITLAKPIVGETCDDPLTMTLGTTIPTALAGFGNDFDQYGPDAVYTFVETVSSTRKVTSSAGLSTGSGRISVYRDACGEATGTGVAYLTVPNDGKSYSTTFATEAGKRYWLVLDSPSTAPGMSLRVD